MKLASDDFGHIPQVHELTRRHHREGALCLDQNRYLCPFPDSGFHLHHMETHGTVSADHIHIPVWIPQLRADCLRYARAQMSKFKVAERCSWLGHSPEHCVEKARIPAV